MSGPVGKRHRGLAARLVLMAAGSFAFGFALVPLYDVFCEIAGIGSREQLLRAGSADGQVPDASRTVVVEFPSRQAALDWYHGEEYQAAKRIRESAARIRFMWIVDGAPGA